MQTELQATARTSGSLVQNILEVLARAMARVAATERCFIKRHPRGQLCAEVLRDTGASHALQDYAGDGEVGSEKRLFNIADNMRMGLPHR